jgi:hypothetical protein
MPRPLPLRAALLCALAALPTPLGACTSWMPLPETRPLRTPVTIRAWVGDSLIRLRDARIVGDSIIGRAPRPDTARIVLARASVRRIEMRDLDLTKTAILAPVVTVGSLGLLFSILCRGDCLE